MKGTLYGRFGSKADNPSAAKIDRCPLWSKSGQARVRLDCPLCANRRHRGSERAVVANPALDHSRDYVCLYFGSNPTTSVYVRNLGRGVVGCGLELACISGFDLVA
jgi:hypothetical protein